MNDDRDLPPLPIRPPEISVAESSRRHSRRSKDSTRDLATLLRLEHSEHLEAKRELSQLTERLRLETLRADEAESRVIEVTERLKRVNEARLIAVGEAARANESLGLYKFQLETAQNEIHRAQSVFNIVEKERYQAELAGARTRTAARRLKEQHKIHVAKEEGRRIGIKEGIEAGRLGVFGDEPDALAPSDLGGSQIDDYENFDDEELSSLGDFAGGEFDSPSPPPRSASILPETNVRNTPVPVPIPPPVLPPLPVPAPGATAPSPSLYEPFHDIHPVPFHNEPPHPRHEHIDVPPDGFIPQTGPDSLPQVPPPHEFSRQHEPNPPRNGASVVEESVIAPSAFARTTSPRQHNDRRSPSVRAQSTRAERRAPSTVGSRHVRTVQMPTPRLNTNIPGIEHQAQHRSSWSSDFPGGGSLAPQRSNSSGPIPINVLPPSRPESHLSSAQMGTPSMGSTLFGPGFPPPRNSGPPPLYAPESDVATGLLGKASISGTSPMPGGYVLPSGADSPRNAIDEAYDQFMDNDGLSTHSSDFQTSTPDTLTTPPASRRPHPHKPPRVKNPAAWPRDPDYVRPPKNQSGPGFGYNGYNGNMGSTSGM